MKAREVIKLLSEDGWYQDRQKGSHKIFKHHEKKGTIPVPDHGAKDIPVGTLKSILKMAGLQ